MSEYADPNQIVADQDQCESWLVEAAREHPNEIKVVSDTLLQRLAEQLKECDCKGCQFAYMVTWYGMSKVTERLHEHQRQIDELNSLYGDADNEV